jgi:hypothetical protein
MALTEKSKEMLKRFLTFSFEKDFGNNEAKEKFADMFRKMVMTNDPGMKDVVQSMFNSFEEYNTNAKVLGNEEPVEEAPPEEAPAEELPPEEPIADEVPPEEAPVDDTQEPEDFGDSDEQEQEDVGGIFGEHYGFDKNILESINDWLEV